MARRWAASKRAKESRRRAVTDQGKAVGAQPDLSRRVAGRELSNKGQRAIVARVEGERIHYLCRGEFAAETYRRGVLVDAELSHLIRSRVALDGLLQVRVGWQDHQCGAGTHWRERVMLDSCCRAAGARAAEANYI